MDDDESKIAEKYEALRGVMDEQIRRLWAATEARALGYGGVSTVARAVGLTRPTITAGMKELGDAREIVPMAPKHRVRREGAGRPRATDSDAGLRPALEELVEPATRGHPMSPLRWTCKSVRTLATELTRQGHAVSHQTVSEVMQNLGYSLQANRKTREGAEHPDRNAQFEHIAQRAKEFQRRGQPVISVDTKKKERASSKGWLVQQEKSCRGRIEVRSPVAWIASRRETEYLKPIDKPSLREGASHRAVT